MQVRIRRYRDADKNGVLMLWRDADIDRPWLDLGVEITEKRRRDRSLFLVASEGARIVGAVMGAYDGRRGWVYHLAAAPERRRRGIGRALMTELERRMVRLGITKVNLQVRADNLQVVGFYQQLGYVDENLTSLEKWLPPPSQK